MEDKNKIKFYFKIGKWILIIIGILIIVLVIANFIFDKINVNNLQNYLENQNYTENNGVWSKNDKINDNNMVSNITLTYTPDINKFTKEMTNNHSTYTEQFRFKYNGDDIITIAYSYSNNKNCSVAQSATYNSKTNDYKCTTTYNSNNCALHCDDIKTEAEKFNDEIYDILEKSKVNKLFLNKNTD